MAKYERKCKSWVASYIDYTRNHRAPAIFHVWGAFSCLSVATLRNLKMDFHYYSVYPNLFMVLVAPPGRCRKSAALEIGVDILRNLKPKVTVLAQKLTPEYLIGTLAEGGEVDDEGFRDLRGTGLIYADELGALLTKDAAKRDIYQCLCTLFDNPSSYIYGTRGRGKEEVQECSIALVGGTTPKWVKIGMPSDTVGEGFAARVIFVYQLNTDKAKGLPKYGENEAKLKASLVEDLEHIHHLKGNFMLSPAAEEAYNNLDEQHESLSYPEGMEEYGARRMMHLLKVAMLDSVGKRDELVVGVEEIAMADAHLKRVEEGLLSLYQLIFTTQKGDDRAFVKRKIAAEGGKVTRSNLMRVVGYRMDKRGLDIVIDTLLLTKEIKRVTAPGKRGRDVVVYVLAKE